MKNLVKLLTLVLLIMISVTACDHRPKVISPIEIPNLDSLKTYVDKANQTEDAKDQYFAALYYLKQYTAADTTKAIDLLTKSAGQKFPFAANELGNIYSADSTNSRYDIKKAIEYYEVGVKGGSDRAMINLASLYINGEGVTPDYKRALQLRTDATLGLLALAEAGDLMAQHRLGCNLVDGMGVVKNQKAGLAWIKKAADKGNMLAQYSMGICYTYGYGGLKKDRQEAFEYFKKAADKGDAKAMTCVASAYKSGIGTEMNRYSAFNNFLKAANLGEQDAMFEVALAYQNGYGTDIDYAEAFKWYKKLAELGNTSAQNNLGAMYQNGQGVVKDEAEAFKWFLKAANAGATFSMRVVGGCYFEGTGVDRDITKAFEWWKKAAESGDKISMQNIAMCYETGLGTAKDASAAEYWNALARN